MDWKKAALDLFFPDIERCYFCGVEFQGAVCAKCEETLAPLYLGDVSFVLHGFPCCSLYQYAGPIRSAIYSMKFEHLPWKALALGTLLASASVNFHDIDQIAYVPVHEKRKAKRGFDQSELLARGLAQKVKKPLVPVLIKTANLLPQSTLSAEERLQNIAGAFSILPGETVRQKRILLVDDVITTGTTICEAASVLAAEKAHVTCISAARTLLASTN